MVHSWRHFLQQAEETFRSGRLDEASRQIREGDLLRFPSGEKLAKQLAIRFGRRSQRALHERDLPSAWHDVHEARLIDESNADILRVRTNLIEASLKIANDALNRNEPSTTMEILDLFQKYHVTDQRCDHLTSVAKRVKSSEEAANRGEFKRAREELDFALRLAPATESLTQLREDLEKKSEEVATLIKSMRRAIVGAQWDAAINLADSVLDIASSHGAAVDAKQLCLLSKKQSEDRRLRHLESTHYWAFGDPLNTNTMTATIPKTEGHCVPILSGASRFLVWIDAVGGYLATPSDEVFVGQAIPDNQIDLPILADISRRHLKLCRVAGGYIVEPFAPVLINDKPIEGRTPLSDGDVIKLGEGVRLRFSKPHPLSGTARLDYESRHRTQPWSDAVLLIADSCLFGPNQRNHVVCPRWKEDVMLFRRENRLFCRAKGEFRIDGRRQAGQGEVFVGSHIESDEFSMCLEAVGAEGCNY